MYRMTIHALWHLVFQEHFKEVLYYLCVAIITPFSSVHKCASTTRHVEDWAISELVIFQAIAFHSTYSRKLLLWHFRMVLQSNMSAFITKLSLISLNIHLKCKLCSVYVYSTRDGIFCTYHHHINKMSCWILNCISVYDFHPKTKCRL